MISLISVVALALSLARFPISVATTANPLPASPALAASIEELRARTFDCQEIELIISRMELIF